ncbi:2-amino-thiazoline-4-carboxylic acid hydrolase [Pokkaliibacter plantistimulans]|uniref:2-amino-thiazoline-4-carboxylic acid hydrolase n=1 Tax=Proteobacteria bacterium 228 TaxID=2083153 RepID=A0A2S5KLK4_9PROT|nr:L-2-amino-thiazoline-4-carboxylic acid hydrolase [Pokkaliibacter plantistimulans]PPC75196.1 2-amino-thiazoline-4-carboxylic acid hydrolase [Pokkaliibacter plantistimulans]
MTTEPAPLPIIEQRRIEARILQHVYEVALAQHGQQAARALLREAVTRSAIAQGEHFRQQLGRMPDLQDFAEALQHWTREDALRIEVKQLSSTQLDFDVTRCRYAEMYREMGLAEIGDLLSCNRDGAFCIGYNPAIEFQRSQTLMSGASHCDFRYRLAGPVASD